MVVSHEEVRVEAELQSILKHLDDIGKGGFQFYNWSCTQGIVNIKTNERIADTQDPLGDNGMLQTFMKLPEMSVLLARDFHPFLAMDNPVMTRTIRDALIVGKKSSRIFITVGCTPKIPPELEKEMAVIEFRLPSKEQLNIVLEGIAKSAGV